MAADESISIPLEDGAFNCKVIGEGEPLVLLHGHGQDHSAFREWESPLSEKFKLILIDSRNHGHSMRTDHINIPLMAGDVYQSLKWLKVDSAKFIGFSDGGNVALQLAVDYGEIVDKLVVISGNATPDGLLAAPRFLFNLWRRMLTVFSPKRLNMAKLLTEQPNITQEDLRSIHAPTLLLFGERDFITRRHIEYLHKNIAGSRFMIVKHARHGTILKKFNSYRQEIIDFLSTKNKNIL